MTRIVKKILVSLCCLYVVQFGIPPVLPAARLAGEDPPAPSVSPVRPGSIVPPLKRQEKKDVPAPPPQPQGRKDASGQIKAKPAEAKEKAVAPPPLGTAPPAAPAVAPAKAASEAVPPPPPAKAPGAAAPPPPPKAPGAVPPPAAPDTKKQAQETRYVTIDFDNVDIAIFVKFVSELTGKNFVIDEKVRAKVTIISPRKISVDEVYKVFESVLEVYGFTTVKAGEVIKIVPALQAREKQLETRIGPEEIIPEDKLVTQIISLEYASPDDVKRVLDPLISRSSVILSYPPTGMLVITDYLSNIKKIMEIIGALDVEGVAAEISYLPLKAASATDIVKSLSLVFQVQAQAAPQLGRAAVAPVRMVADDRANSIILVASELDTGRIKKLIALMDKDVPRGSATLRVYRLQNAVAEDLAKVLMSIPREPATAARPPTPPGVPATAAGGRSPMLSKDVQILADKATNTLIITANQDDYRVLEEVIKSLDVSRPMVFIEALVMEVSTTKDFKVGVEWRGLMDTGSVPGFSTGRTAAFVGSSGGGLIPGTSINTATGTGALAFPEGFAFGILGAGISIGSGTSQVFFPNIGAVVQAFQKDSDVSILSTPQIMTIDNEEAEIKVVENVPYITRQDTSVSLPGQTLGQSFEYRDVGVTLNITPHINEEDFVRLKLNQKVNQVVSGSDPLRPTTLNREAKTTVVVKDKETIVIGGLLKDNTDTSVFGVPCLSSIPVFGWLFKTEARNRDKTNLFVFITPHIIRTQKDAADLYKDKRDQMGEVVEGVIKLREKRTPK